MNKYNKILDKHFDNIKNHVANYINSLDDDVKGMMSTQTAFEITLIELSKALNNEKHKILKSILLGSPEPLKEVHKCESNKTYWYDHTRLSKYSKCKYCDKPIYENLRQK